jgi:hypothetical protein
MDPKDQTRASLVAIGLLLTITLGMLTYQYFQGKELSRANQTQAEAIRSLVEDIRGFDTRFEAMMKRRELYFEEVLKRLGVKPGEVEEIKKRADSGVGPLIPDRAR